MSEEESELSSDSSESSSDTDDETIQDIPDQDFFKTLSCLKNRDPKIYDSSVQFFPETPSIIRKTQNFTTDVNNSRIEKESEERTVGNLKTNKFSLKEIDNDSSSEDEMSAFKKSPAGKPQSHINEDEYIQFLKGKTPKISDKDTESTLKPLHDYWNSKELDENEKFLKDYILNKKYMSVSGEINAEEDLSEDEKELEEQAEYEANYNFRFENEENLKLKRYPRAIEGSLRRKNDARSKKRAEVAQRKKEEKLKKQQEIKKKQKQKLSEIEERLKKLKELTGNVELGFKDAEILEDFDPEKHDRKMNELFNDDYYNTEDQERPVFDDEGINWEDNEFTDEINMDCDAQFSDPNQKKLTRTQKKKLKKKKSFQDIMDMAKPSFDPNVHNDFKKYIDEFYSLDCEDFIDDMPCKFKYREVVPNDYGLSIEEILLADDSELNRWASIKKINKRCPEHVEKNEVKIFKKKAQDEYLKKKLLPSLFIDPENENDKLRGSSERNEQPDEATDFQLQERNSNDEILNKKSKKNKKKLKHVVETSNTENMEVVEELSIGCTKEPVRKSNENEGKTSSENSNKRKRRKKKKKGQATNNASESGNSEHTGNERKPNSRAVSDQHNNRNFNKQEKITKIQKFKNKLGFKKKKEGIVNLSDSRLHAYGIKPKQFRSKILYSQKSDAF